MGLTADNLREGLPVSFHCLGRDVQEIHQFMKGFVNGNVGNVRLAGVQTEGERKLMEDGTRWIVHETANPGIFTFECDGTGRFLDGVTANCTVGLAPSSRPPFIGTAWKVRDFPNPDLGGFAHVSLQCQGNLGDPGNPRQCPLGFLDGRTAVTDGSVGLAKKTEEPFSGAHWELLIWESEVREGGGAGGGPPDPGGLPV
jgi:hypothetical protein